jgi:hypothetical protein
MNSNRRADDRFGYQINIHSVFSAFSVAIPKHAGYEGDWACK